MDLLNPRRKSDVVLFKKNKRINRLVDFSVPTGHKLKDSEKKIDRELKMQWNIMVNVVGDFGMVVEKALKISIRIKTIRTAALLRLARILRRILETRGNLLSFSPQRKTTY